MALATVVLLALVLVLAADAFTRQLPVTRRQTLTRVSLFNFGKKKPAPAPEPEPEPPAPVAPPPAKAQGGFFDDLKVIFSKEGQQNLNSYKEREKEEQLRAQREILERRRNPQKMREYEEKKDAERKKYAEERAVYSSFQGRKDDGYDPLQDWQRLRAEGKVKMSKDLERDKGSARLGSEGLIEVRVDERMPYIDQGYVDDSADVMGKFMGLFGKKKEAK